VHTNAFIFFGLYQPVFLSTDGTDVVDMLLFFSC